MGGCCKKDGDNNSHQEAPTSPDERANASKESLGEAAGCCEGSACGCNDDCFDELARVMCADDETHIHDHDAPDAKVVADNTSVTSEADAQSDCTCCEGDKSNPVEKKASATSSDAACGHSGLRKRVVAKGDKPVYPQQACGEHRSIARTRYNDTLAAFGCVCKALLARGLQSCCTATSRVGKSAARSISSKHGSRRMFAGRASHDSTRPASIDSCCSQGKCGARTPSVQSIPIRGHVVDLQNNPTAASSKVSVDSCCRDECCGGERASLESAEEKGPHVAVDMAEKIGDNNREHAVLAIKGMTCTGCENKLIRTLHGIPAINNVKTSLVLCRAEFDFDNTSTDIPTLVTLIEKHSGFSAEVIPAGSIRDLLVAIPSAMQDDFVVSTKPLGVEAVVRSDKNTFLVVYDPCIIGAREVLLSYKAFSPILAPEPPDPALMAGAKHIRYLSLRMVLSAILTIPVLVMTWAPLPPHPRAYGIASLVLATIVQVGITGPFYVSSFKSLFFSRLVETELLIVLSTTAAYVYSVAAFGFDMVGRPLQSGEFFETSTLLVTLIMVGQVVSAIARQRAMEAISIRSLQARTALVALPDGGEEELDVRLVQYGDVFKVLPDTAIITDGKVISGTSTVDESMMTGESRPVEKGPGSVVVAGTLNGPSTLLVKVTRLPGENTISDIAQMVDEARFSRARVQEVVDRICGWFVPTVLVVALITFAVQLAVGVAVRGQGRGVAAVAALTYAISVLAVSCPCALGLAVPMVILIAGGVGAKMGLVFKAATTIEQARRVTHVVFDKTGTVTRGKLSVLERFVDETPAFDVLAAVAQLIASSRHPVALAVAASLPAPVADGPQSQAPVEDIEMVVGKGIQGSLFGTALRGGSASWLGLSAHPAVAPLLARGLTVFCVVHSSQLIAAFGLADALRPEAHSVIRALDARGVKVSLLSGDHPAAVAAVAAELGVPHERALAGRLPADKQAYIQQLTQDGEVVLFCGDGTNDAVALAQAAIGVHLDSAPSTGAPGAGAAAAAAADVVLTRADLRGVSALLELADAAARRVGANFAWAAAYNLVAVLFAAGAFVDARIPPAYAGLGELVSVLPVVLVALQLKWFKPRVWAA